MARHVYLDPHPRDVLAHELQLAYDAHWDRLHHPAVLDLFLARVDGLVESYWVGLAWPAPQYDRRRFCDLFGTPIRLATPAFTFATHGPGHPPDAAILEHVPIARVPLGTRPLPLEITQGTPPERFALPLARGLQAMAERIRARPPAAIGMARVHLAVEPVPDTLMCSASCLIIPREDDA